MIVMKIVSGRGWKIALVLLLVLCLLILPSSCEYLGEYASELDSDGDGWPDTQEEQSGTDPDNVDTDNDGYWDPHDPNPLNPDIPEEGGAPETASVPAQPPASVPSKPASTNITTPASPEQAALKEYQEVQDAVIVMMKHNGLNSLEQTSKLPSSDMRRFPDSYTRHGEAGMGYVLYCHDFDGDGKPDINYIHLSQTVGTYVCSKNGEVTQISTGYE